MRESRVPATQKARRLIASAVAVAIGATGLVVIATSASAVAAPKYFVCKYVGTPGDNERLQTGGNPISVSGNAINANPVVVGSYFADKHGRSYVLAEDVGQEELPACPGDPVDETPLEVPVTPPVFTAPTCAAIGTLVYADGGGVEWTRTGTDSAAVLTATAIGGATLTGQTVHGPYDLTQLTGEVCLATTPVIETVVPTVVTPAALAETGFPLLGVLGLAGSFSLIGGGLINARRLLRKSA